MHISIFSSQIHRCREREAHWWRNKGTRRLLHASSCLWAHLRIWPCHRQLNGALREKLQSENNESYKSGEWVKVDTSMYQLYHRWSWATKLRNFEYTKLFQDFRAKKAISYPEEPRAGMIVCCCTCVKRSIGATKLQMRKNLVKQEVWFRCSRPKHRRTRSWAIWRCIGLWKSLPAL